MLNSSMYNKQKNKFGIGVKQFNFQSIFLLSGLDAYLYWWRGIYLSRGHVFGPDKSCYTQKPSSEARYK